MDIMHISHEPAVVLALFHTAFNFMGVLILWPFTDKLVSFIEKRFASLEDDRGRPKYLDNNVIGTPTLALDALTLEMERIAQLPEELYARGLIRFDTCAPDG